MGRDREKQVVEVETETEAEDRDGEDRASLICYMRKTDKQSDLLTC